MIQVTNPMTGLLNKPQGFSLSTSASKAVDKATTTPTDGARLGTNAPVVQPKPQPSTALNSLQALNTSTATNVQTNQAQVQKMEAQAPAPEPQLSPLQQTLQGILGIGGQLETKGARSLEIQQQEGVFDKKERAKQLENEILSRSQAYEKQIREAQKNPEGKSWGAMEADVNDLRRQSAQELADLSIAYKVASDDYAGAWEIAQAKIDAEFEPLQQRLETLKTYYQLAQNDMTESEKMQAQQKIREQESALDFERTKQLKAYEQQIRQSDPLYQAQVRAQEASIANIYDQMDARRQATRDAINQATTVAEKEQLEKLEASDSLLEMRELMNSLTGMSGMSSAVGVGFKKTILDKIPFVSGDAVEGSARQDFEIAAKRLSDMFLVQNLDKMTGVLTDKDLEVLRAEGTTIGNFDQSEKSWLKEKARLERMIERGIRENGITEEQALYWGVMEQNDMNTFNSLWDQL
jgi:hypothetical protein